MPADTLDLTGKIAIVTGSGRENGIGAAIAIALARNGALVAINYVSNNVTKRAEAVAEKIKEAGGKATVIQADLRTIEGAEKLTKGTMEAFGTKHIDILVNNAGIGTYHSTLTLSVEEIDNFYKLNVCSAIYMVKQVVPVMAKGGRIINVSSIVSKTGMGAMPIYSSSKAALDSLTYCWAQEFGKSHNITVNTVAPGPVDTDQTSQLMDLEALRPIFYQMTRAADRYGTTDDIADAVLLLVSEKGRWITGQFISVSGGITGG